MKELLYVDERRLNRYATQAVPSLAKIEKTKELNAELAITGPKVSFGQKERTRPLTEFERIEEVLALLKRTGDLQTSRPETDDVGPAFVHETCEAVKVIVPHSAEAGFENAEIRLWLSQAAAQSGPATLCLLEDDQGQDDTPVTFRHASTYTLLQSLVHYTRMRRIRTVIDLHVPNDPHPNPSASFEGQPHSLAQYHNVQRYAYEFTRNPASLLTQWGCLVATPRRVQVVYRIREVGGDSTYSWRRVSTFGYPIWIISA